MSTVTVKTCDRCKIPQPKVTQQYEWSTMIYKKKTYDLCNSCTKSLEEYLEHNLFNS